MPEYTCSICQRNFFISKANKKNLLFHYGLICSLDCVKDHLMVRTAGKKPIVFGAKNIPAHYDVWDSVTRQGYRSWYEAHVARFLHSFGISFSYEKYEIPLGRSRYTPDFFLPRLNLFIEVKGLWAMSSKTKLRKAIAQGYEVLLLPWYLAKDFRKEYGMRREFI